MNTWAPLWSGIVDSSIWTEPDYVIKVFITMMALKDSDHIVRLTAYQIGQRSKKSEQEVLDALKILSSPDTKRLEPQPHEGRRIRWVDEGWLILNGEKYRDMVRLEMKRARDRKAQAKRRAMIASKKYGPTASELHYNKQINEGKDPDALRETPPTFTAVSNGQPPTQP